jgi:tetratricopeptide (TPR) repeat protein
VTDEASEARFRRAQVLADVNRPAEALRELAPVRASEPGTSRVHLLAARCLLELGQYDGALDAANGAASCAPEWAPPQIFRSLAYTRLGDHQKAASAAATAVRLAPDSSDAHMVLAETRARLGDTKEGLVHARQAVTLNPGSAAAFVSLSFVSLKAGRWRACEEAARQALVIDPDSSVAMNNLGMALRHRRHPSAALRMFSRSVNANPTGRLGQGNANATIMKLGGWLLCLVISTLVLLAWVLEAPVRLDHPGLVGIFAGALTATVIAVIGTAVWVRRLPRAVRRSLSDRRAWIQTFNGKATPTALKSWVLPGGRIHTWPFRIFFTCPDMPCEPPGSSKTTISKNSRA